MHRFVYVASVHPRYRLEDEQHCVDVKLSAARSCSTIETQRRSANAITRLLDAPIDIRFGDEARARVAPTTRENEPSA